MRKIKIQIEQTLLFIFLFISINLQAQEHLCISKDHLLNLPHVDQHTLHVQDQLDRMWVIHQKNKNNNLSFPASAPTLEVSVVFHIISSNGVGIPDAQIQDALAYLNEAFENIGYYDPSTGVDVEIQFCMAKQDPKGLPTNGINRIQSTLSTMTMESQDLDLKNLSRWSPTCYMNVWVVDEILSSSTGPGVAGYAFFPSSHGSDVDGIVIESRYTGSGRPENIVLAHEVGHYLGLYHTFQDGCKNDDCMVDGDLICDTPPDQSTAYATCSQGMNTCNTDANSGFTSDQPDMISNYMDYSRLECYNQFTALQKDRMRFYLEGIRSSLLSCTGCKDPCNTPITIQLNVNPNPAFVCDSIRFVNTTQNADVFEWTLDQSFYSNDKNITLFFDKPGRHQVILIASNATGNCVARDTIDLIIECSFSVELKDQPLTCYEEGKKVELELMNTNGANISWFIDGQLESSIPSLSKTLTPGAYQVKVIGDNGKCRDSLSFNILVGCVEICGNGFDDDGDGLYDCYDPDCCNQCEDFYYKACSEDYQVCIKPQAFSIKEKWRAKKSDYLVVSSMLAGDMNGDGETEIVTFNLIDQVTFLGSDGRVKWSFKPTRQQGVNWVNPPAIADTDKDGKGEYFYIALDGTLICTEHDGAIKFTTGIIPTQFGILQFQAIQIADLNMDGNAEVIVAYHVYDANTGQLLVSPPASVQRSVSAGHYVLCDILPDDACPNCKGLEIINGSQVISISEDNLSMQVERQIPNGTRGDGGVVDWDLDGDLDVIGVFRDLTVVWDGQSTNIIAITNQGSAGGAPVISNMDSDPEPELAFFHLGDWMLRRFDNDLSLTWERPIGQPSSINPLCFDFHNDGINEILIRDSEKIAIYNAENGVILFESECFSVTNDERPLIADIDGNGHAEIIISCATEAVGAFGELIAFEGDVVEWPKTRPVMNQYDFYNIHINDDLTVPSFSQQVHLPQSIQDLNTHMTQVIIPSDIDTMELSLLLDSIWCDNGQYSIPFTLCSSGKKLVDSIFVSFYDGTPSDVNSSRIQTTKISITDLQSSNCFSGTFTLSLNSPLVNKQICIIVNDEGLRPLPFDFTDGSGFGGPGECDYLNNLDCINVDLISISIEDILDQVICNADSLLVTLLKDWPNYLWSNGDTDKSTYISKSGLHWVEVSDGCGAVSRDSFFVNLASSPILDLPDTIIACKDGVNVLDASSNFVSYRWQDGFPNSKYTTFAPGKYWVEVVDSCGNIQSDTTWIILENLPDLNLPDTVTICDGDSILLQASNYPQVLWEPDSITACRDCLNNLITTKKSGWVYAYGINSKGCGTADSVYIKLGGQRIVFDTILICPKDSILYEGLKIGIGDHVFTFGNTQGCDTILNLAIRSLGDEMIKEIISICYGDSLLYKDQFYKPGNYEIKASGNNGQCDTTIMLMIMERQQIKATVQTIPTCPGDSTGKAIVIPDIPGMYLLNWSGGNDLGDGSADGFKPGKYGVIVIDQFNCSERFEFIIDTYPIPNFDLSILFDSCGLDQKFSVNLNKDVIGKLEGNNYNKLGIQFDSIPEGTYQLSVSDTNDCFKFDTTLIFKYKTITVFDTFFLCPNDTLVLKGKRYTIGDYSEMISNLHTCDTIQHISVKSLDNEVVNLLLPVCNGDSLLFKGKQYHPGTHDVIVRGLGKGCDTTYVLTVTERAPITATFDLTPTCRKDSTGEVRITTGVPGGYTYKWSGGKDLGDGMANGLKSGQHSVTITDDINCSRVFNFSIDTFISPIFDVFVSLDSCGENLRFSIQLDGDVSARLTGNNIDEEGSIFEDITEGEFQLSISDFNGCHILDTLLELTHESMYNYDIQSTVVIRPGDTAFAFITGDIIEAIDFSWINQDGLLCTTCNYLSSNPTENTEYTVFILDSDGCIHKLTVLVFIDNTIDIFVPNIFTPNDDNVNDLLKIFSSSDSVNIVSFEIYSRWGNLVFKEENTAVNDFIGWDGKFNNEMLNPGVFVYKVTYNIDNGPLFYKAGSLTMAF